MICHDVIKCPYADHLISTSRIQKHLVKCEKRFPANYKVMCPYNATHRIFKHELNDHILACPSRNILWTEKFCSESSIRNYLTFDDCTDISSMSNVNDECWDHETCSLVRENVARTNDEPINIQEHASELGLEGTNDEFRPLRIPRSCPEGALTEEPEGSVIEDDQSIISSMGIGRGRALSSTGLKTFVLGRGKLPIPE